MTRFIRLEGKRWFIASLHGGVIDGWAWLVNTARPDEQVRLSIKHPELAELITR